MSVSQSGVYAKMAAAVHNNSNGYGFRLSGERQSLVMLSDWVSLERLCCPFFTFEIQAGSEAQPIWLRMTGRDGVKAFMQSEFGIK